MSDEENSENKDNSKSSEGHNVTSFNQRGGITAGELNIGNQQRSLSKQNKETILGNLEKDAEIKVTSVMGDGEAFQYAQEIKRFLEENGYGSVEGIARVIKAQPTQGQVINTDPDNADYEIHVGSQ